MHVNLATWLDKLEHRQLPALSPSTLRLAQIVHDDNVSVLALSSVIERDPGLAVSVVRGAQSQKQRRLTTSIATVTHALMLLGMSRVHELTAQVPLMDELVKEPMVASRLLALYARAHHAAVQARNWAQRRLDKEPDEVQLATQLLDLGEMLLWLEAPALMTELERVTASAPGARSQAECAILGCTLADLTAALARRWGLPELLPSVLQPENATHPRIAGILLARELALAAENDWYDATTNRTLERIAVYLKMDYPEAVAHVHRTAVTAARTGTHIAAQHAAALLLHPIHGETMTNDVATSVTTYPSNAGFYREVLENLQRPGMDVSTILALTLEAMHKGTGFSRVTFAIPTKEGRLQGRHALGATGDSRFRNFHIPLTCENLFVRLLQKPQAVWISTANREHFAPLLPPELKDMADGDGFYAASMFIGEQPVGIFYADRHHASRTLDAEAYHQFKQLVLAASRAMANARA